MPPQQASTESINFSDTLERDDAVVSLSKAERLRALLTSPQLEFIMEAHDGLSAKIVEEAGFQGIWASGLTVSAALGVRDSNEASWTQVLEVLEFMADAILIHSKQSSADEILTFANEWGNRCPVVIVPTTYYDTPTDHYRQSKISMIFWANHNLRAAITAMRETSSRILREESLVGVEHEVSSVKDVFELAGNDELATAEKRYLPVRQGAPKAIILAASRGTELGDLTEDRPKCMIDVRDQPMLRRLVDTMNGGAVRDITVVRGYRKEIVNLPTIKVVDNDLFGSTGEAATLACFMDALLGDCLIAYGDILFRQYIMDQILEAEGDIVLVVDALWRDRDPDPKSRLRDLVACSTPFITGYLDEGPVIAKMLGPDIPELDIGGEWIGLARVSEAGAEALRSEIGVLRQGGNLGGASLCDLFNRLIARGCEVRVLYITGHWLDVDNQSDLEEARSFL